MKILVKIPTRERPVNFFKILEGYMELSTKNDIQYLISLDTNDFKMNNPTVLERLKSYGNVIYFTGNSLTKVEAYNRDIHHAEGWDIIVVASDDMVCVCPAWDEIIRQEIEHYFPDTDGVLHFNDGYTGNKLNTLPIIGRKYYERFGYVYNPTYTSLFCDNEFMEVASSTKRQVYSETILFKHEHPAWNANVKPDGLMKRNESFYLKDKAVYEKRKLNNFE